MGSRFHRPNPRNGVCEKIINNNTRMENCKFLKLSHSLYNAIITNEKKTSFLNVQNMVRPQCHFRFPNETAFFWTCDILLPIQFPSNGIWPTHTAPQIKPVKALGQGKVLNKCHSIQVISFSFNVWQCKPHGSKNIWFQKPDHKGLPKPSLKCDKYQPQD